MVICSQFFQGKTESFAVVKQFHSVAVIMYQIVSMSTGNGIQIKYLMSGLVLFAFPSLFLIRKLFYKTEKEEEALISEIKGSKNM